MPYINANSSRLQARRDADVRRLGSPNFLHIFGAIATTAQESIEIASQFPAARKYQPLMEMVVKNGSTEALDLFLTGFLESRIMPGTVESFNNRAIWSVQLTNNDTGTAAAGLVTINVYTPALSADQAARERG